MTVFKPWYGYVIHSFGDHEFQYGNYGNKETFFCALEDSAAVVVAAADSWMDFIVIKNMIEKSALQY